MYRYIMCILLIIGMISGASVVHARGTLFSNIKGENCTPKYQLIIRDMEYRKIIFADSVDLHYFAAKVEQNKCMMLTDNVLRIPYYSIVYIEELD